MLLLSRLELKKNPGQTGNDTPPKNVKIMVPLKYLSNFLRIPEMPSINFKINLDLNYSKLPYTG